MEEENKEIKIEKKHSTQYTAEELQEVYTSIIEPNLEYISMLYFDGTPFGDIAKALKIPATMLWAMRINKSFTALREIFKIKKMMSENVEFALYRRAIGYFVQEEVPMKVKRKYTNKLEKECTKEEVRIVKVRKYIAPDVNAQKFWLLNHDADKYHPENAKTEGEGIDKLLENASSVLVQVKNLANDSNETTDCDNGDNDEQED